MGSQAALPHIPRSRGVERKNPGDVAGGAACEWPGATRYPDQCDRRSSPTDASKVLVSWWPVHQAPCLSTCGWPLFRRERAKFLSLFRWERGEISRKFRENFEISCARIHVCALVFNSPISLSPSRAFLLKTRSRASCRCSGPSWTLGCSRRGPCPGWIRRVP